MFVDKITKKKRLVPLLFPNNNNDDGFTLIEVLIVISILAILAGIAIPQYNKYRKRAFATKVLSAVEEIALKEANYSSDYNKGMITLTLENSKPSDIITYVVKDDFSERISLPKNTKIIVLPLNCAQDEGLSISATSIMNITVTYNTCNDAAAKVIE